MKKNPKLYLLLLSFVLGICCFNVGITEASVTPVFVKNIGSFGTSTGQFNDPTAIAIDSFGDIYVVDSGNNRIEKFDPSGNFIFSFGSYGSGNGQFNDPTGVAVDAYGNIYVTDDGNSPRIGRVEKFDKFGNYVSQWVDISTGQYGALRTANVAVSPWSDIVYVSDPSNGLIEESDTAGTYIGRIGGYFGGPGGFVAAPSYVTVDSLGNVYAVDPHDGRVEIFDSTGTYRNQWTGLSPTGIAIDNVGDIYQVNSTGVITIHDATGAVIGTFGSTGSGNGQFQSAAGIAVSTAGDIYVVDSTLNHISVFHETIPTPTVSIVDPSPNTTASGSIMVTATSTDSTAAGVTFYLDGVALASEVGNPPYVYVLDTTTVSPRLVNTVTATSPFSANPYQYVFVNATSSFTDHILTAVSRSQSNTYSTSTPVVITMRQNGTPAINTPMVSAISSTSAVVSSSIVDGGLSSSTVAGFNYGSTAKYGVSTSTGGVFGSGYQFNADLTGLVCGTQYQIAAFATNSQGVGRSSNQTFSTSPCAVATSSVFQSLPDYYDYNDTLLVINDASATSTTIGNYFVAARNFPIANIVHINTPVGESISRTAYTTNIKTPIENFLTANNLSNTINYIILTKDVPLMISDNGNSVDSELSGCLGKTTCPGNGVAPASPYGNFYANQNSTLSPMLFSHAVYNLYLVTRLDGYSISDVENLIDRSNNASTTSVTPGQFVLDEDPNQTGGYLVGNQWMTSAAPIISAKGYSVDLDKTNTYLTGLSNVQGYYSWGSNDSHAPAEPIPGNSYNDGAIAETIVSTSARTFTYPPSYGQSLIADLIRNGVSGVGGDVSEPGIGAIAHADILFDRYTSGYNMADSFYGASFYEMWKDVFVGDPKMIMFPYTPFSIISSGSSLVISGTSPQITWQNQHDYHGGISKYQLYIDGTLAVDNIIATSTVLSTNGISLGSHQYFIKAFDGNGNYAGVTPTMTLSIVSQPSSFNLVSPASGSSSLTATPTFSWQAATDPSGIMKYQLFVDGILEADNILGTSYELSIPLSAESHTWSVRAVNNTGEFTDSSSSYTLITPSFLNQQYFPPTVSVSLPSSLTQTTATLNASLANDGNASSTVEGFNWGTDTSYGSTASSTGTFGVGIFSQLLTGLSCATTYHYDAFSVNLAGTTTSPDQTFTTDACLVVSSGGGSSGGTSFSGGGGGGGSISPTVLSTLLAPSASTTSPLAAAEINCPANLVCTPNPTLPPQTSLLPSVNLTLGSQGTDVVSLQNFLISQGDLDSQYNTGFFGSLTQSALAKYQSDHRITPAIGYYGPLTRAVIASNGVSATTVTTTTAAPATTTSSSTSTTTFTRNLQLGDTGSDVEALQHFLNTHGFSVASTGPGSLGNETTYFGLETRDALVKFQTANNITPAVGYFGEVTRGYINGRG